ncbi:MAG: M1 family aminopeptidase, partial [Nocardioides sp.]
VSLDGTPVAFEQAGKDLVVTADVATDERYVVALDYSGVPEPVEAPTTRDDVPALGWTTMPDGAVWTMQEPFGAYSWYAVNDHPSDKALYDFTLRVPDPMVGVANGELTSREQDEGQTVTRWHLAEPASSYLVTVAFGDYVTAEETSASGVPVSIWLPADEASRMSELRRTTVAALDWSEEVLGPYPFDSLGFLFVDSTSGMETQTMVTLGLTDYAMSEPVLVHEAVHQWWGNQVTPRDWRDLWMNEGMTMYLQAMWESENGGEPLESRLADWAADGPELRAAGGPPAAYDAATFAEGNVYYLPAVMWHQIRGRIGDDEFFRLLKEWPASRDNGHADYDAITTWWEEESGEELTAVFRRHLLSKRQPAYTP